MLKLLDGEVEPDHVFDPAAAIPDQSTRMSRIQTKTPPDEEDMLLVGKSRVNRRSIIIIVTLKSLDQNHSEI